MAVDTRLINNSGDVTYNYLFFIYFLLLEGWYMTIGSATCGYGQWRYVGYFGESSMGGVRSMGN